MNGQRVLSLVEDEEPVGEEEQPPAGAQPADEALLRTRLEYAQRCFANVQDLSRLMDQKAGYLLSAVSLLTLALGVVAAKSLDLKPTAALHEVVHTTALLFMVGYTVVAFLVVYLTTRVFHALPHRRPPQPDAPGLMFPLMLLDRIEQSPAAKASEQVYFEQLNKVTVQGIMKDYSNQIIEVSTIYRHKQKQINRATSLFGLLVVSWVVTMLLLMVTLIIQ